MLVVVPGGGESRARGQEAARLLLAGGRGSTAIVCVNDLLALGVLRALHVAGVRVPAEVSVAGMGGFADLSPPHMLLTTMADDYHQIGREAGRLILERIDGRRTGSPERRIVEARLRRGETTGPAPE